MKYLVIQKKIILIHFLLIPLTFILCNQKICDYCSKELQDQYIIHKNNNYHHYCYDKHIQIYCDQCDLKIDGSYNSSNGKNYQFQLNSADRENLLNGWDMIDKTLLNQKEIIEFERRDQSDRPWQYR